MGKRNFEFEQFIYASAGILSGKKIPFKHGGDIRRNTI